MTKSANNSNYIYDIKSCFVNKNQELAASILNPEHKKATASKTVACKLLFYFAIPIVHATLNID